MFIFCLLVFRRVFSFHRSVTIRGMKRATGQACALERRAVRAFLRFSDFLMMIYIFFLGDSHCDILLPLYSCHNLMTYPRVVQEVSHEHLIIIFQFSHNYAIYQHKSWTSVNLCKGCLKMSEPPHREFQPDSGWTR